MDPTTNQWTPEEILLYNIGNAKWENQYIQEDATVKNRCYCGRFFKPLISSMSLQHYFSNIDFAKVKENVQMATRAVKRTHSTLTAREKQNIITTAVGKYNELINKIAEKRNGDGVDYDLLLITAPRIKQMTQGHESDEESLKGKEKEPRENHDEICEHTQDSQLAPTVEEKNEDVPSKKQEQISEERVPEIVEIAHIAEQLETKGQETAQDPITLPVELPATTSQDTEDPAFDLENLLSTYPPLFTETDAEKQPTPLVQQTQQQATLPSEFSFESLQEYVYSTTSNEGSEKESQLSQEEETLKLPVLQEKAKQIEIEVLKEEDKKVERRRSPRLRGHDKQDAAIQNASQERSVRPNRRRPSIRGRHSKIGK